MTERLLSEWVSILYYYRARWTRRKAGRRWWKVSETRTWVSWVVLVLPMHASDLRDWWLMRWWRNGGLQFSLQVMLLCNHGFVVCGSTVEDALHLAFHVVISCETQACIFLRFSTSAMSVRIFLTRSIYHSTNAVWQPLTTIPASVNLTVNLTDISKGSFRVHAMRDAMFW